MIKNFNKNLKLVTKQEKSSLARSRLVVSNSSGLSHLELNYDEKSDHRISRTSSTAEDLISWEFSQAREYFKQTLLIEPNSIKTERLENSMLPPKTQRLEPQSTTIFSYQNLSPSDRLVSAINRYRYQAQLNPDSAIVQTNLGRLYHKNQQLPEAIRCYKRAIAVDENYYQAREYLAEIINN